MVSKPGNQATPRSNNSKNGLGSKSKTDSLIEINSIKPSPENDQLYKPVDPEDPEIIKLAESIREKGLLEPIVYTSDGYIVSGHRRYCAAQVAGLEMIPVTLSDITRADDIDAFIEELAAYNIQRKKTFDEEVREEAIRQNPDEAYYSLLQERSRTGCIIEPFEIAGEKKRSLITRAKVPFLEAIIKVMHDRKEHLPLTVRQVHYALLNNPPLKHASKPDSTYQNTQKDYKNLTNLIARARMEGYISMQDIADPTRPVTIWKTHRGTQAFIGEQQRDFLNRYCRDLMQSQPDHIEILAEKNTILPFVNRVAVEYCLPTTSGRGYCSVTPRYEMAQRYFTSGKNKLIVLIVSDFDPDGEEIAQSFVRSLRDEFKIKNVHPIKVALTHEQVKEYDLIPDAQAKKTSAQYKKFVERYGTEDVFEVEALEPEQLEDILKAAINDVIDLDLYNQEVLQERNDAARISAYRKAVFNIIKDYDFNN